MCWVYFLNQKQEVFEVSKAFNVSVEDHNVYEKA